MRVAIHQPNFFPWIGIFHRIAMVDVFIFFDHVQAVRGKSWQSRNKIIFPNRDPQWLTIPIEKSGKSFQKVTDVRINYSSNFERKHLGTIKQVYGKCPFFDEMYSFVESLYERKFEKLSNFNKEYIRCVSSNIGLKAKFKSSEEFVEENDNLSELDGNELVLKLCMQAGATQYISGEGCLDFIDPPEFERNGIEFYFQRFIHPKYNQLNTNSFVSHLSSLDALFNIGYKEFGKLMNDRMIERAG